MAKWEKRGSSASGKLMAKWGKVGIRVGVFPSLPRVPWVLGGLLPGRPDTPGARYESRSPFSFPKRDLH